MLFGVNTCIRICRIFIQALGFTNGRGQPVCCCVIIVSESIGTLDILGIDIMEFGKNFIKKKYKDDDELLQF